MATHSLAVARATGDWTLVAVITTIVNVTWAVKMIHSLTVDWAKIGEAVAAGAGEGWNRCASGATADVTEMIDSAATAAEISAAAASNCKLSSVGRRMFFLNRRVSAK